MKFRKKPVVIEAFQLTPENRRTNVDWPHWANEAWQAETIRPHPGDKESKYASPLIIQTKEGSMEASIGDWIIRGIKGELYPCKPDIFAATYNTESGASKVSATPILGFIIRYWPLLILNVLLVWAALADAVFAHLGSLIYLPAVGSSLLTCTLFLRHLFYRNTLDADAASGTFVAEWRALDARTRQILTAVYFGVLFIGLALVAASVGK